MRTRQTLWLITGMMSIFACTAPVAKSTEYDVRFNRPARPGQKFHMTADYKMIADRKAIEGRQVISPHYEVSIKFEATATILEVAKEGYVTKASYQVAQLTKSPKTLWRDHSWLIPKGATVIADWKNCTTVFKVDGESPKYETAGALSVLIPINQDAVIFGDLARTPGRRKLGETWNLNTEKLAEIMGQRGFHAADMTGMEITGTVTLKKKLKIHGKDCLQFDFHITINNAHGNHSGLAYSEATITSEWSFFFPIDTSQPLVKIETKRSMWGIGRGKFKYDDQPVVVFDIFTEESMSKEFKVLE